MQSQSVHPRIQRYQLVKCVDGSSTKKGAHADGTGHHRGSGTRTAGGRGTRGSSAGSLVVDRGGRSRLARGEGKLGDRGGAGEGTLAIFVARVSNGSIAGVEDLVDNVDNTVRDQDVSNCDASTVHKDATLLANGNGKVGAIESSEDSSIRDSGGVANSAVDNVVGEDASNVLGGSVGESRANVRESLSRRSEDSDIWGSVDSFKQVGRVESTAKASEVGSGESVGDGLGQDKESVDNVDHTAGEVDVLCHIR